jgi:hypothetical protein
MVFIADPADNNDSQKEASLNQVKSVTYMDQSIWDSPRPVIMNSYNYDGDSLDRTKKKLYCESPTMMQSRIKALDEIAENCGDSVPDYSSRYALRFPNFLETFSNQASIKKNSSYPWSTLENSYMIDVSKYSEHGKSFANEDTVLVHRAYSTDPSDHKSNVTHNETRPIVGKSTLANQPMRGKRLDMTRSQISLEHGSDSQVCAGSRMTSSDTFKRFTYVIPTMKKAVESFNNSLSRAKKNRNGLEDQLNKEVPYPRIDIHEYMAAVGTNWPNAEDKPYIPPPGSIIIDAFGIEYLVEDDGFAYYLPSKYKEPSVDVEQNYSE